MQKFLFVIVCLSILRGTDVFAEASLTDCPDLIRKAENQTESIPDIPDIYDFCEFDKENIVWEKWAPFASQHQLKKALYEICVRYPNHIYHDSYCEKSAALGYGPALALKAEKLLDKNKEKGALKWATKAIETRELSLEQTGQLLEKIGIYYFKNNNSKYQTYLEQAAMHRSALANHLLGVLSYDQFTTQQAEEAGEDEKKSFQYMWRAILLGCPNAEQNLGLFHLARQKKIPYKTAASMMHTYMTTCAEEASSKSAEEADDPALLNCRCQTAFKNAKRFQEKPYILERVENETAFLKDSAQTAYQVRVGDNLPQQAKVAEIHKSAVILTYPNDRVIINLYKPDPCVDFCNKHHIEENLTPTEMKKRIKGDQKIIIQPYRLRFTPEECDTLLYYAPDLVDVSLPFVGKEECTQADEAPSENPILKQIEAQKEQAETSQEQDKPKENFSEQAKKRLKSLGDDLMLTE